MQKSDKNSARIELRPVMLGTGLIMPGDFRKALRTARIAVSDDAETMLDQVAVAHMLSEVEPVIVSVHELGYEMTDLFHILAGGIERGLQLCSSELAPQMCLQHMKALPNVQLHIAMDPVLSGSRSLIHSVLRIQGKLWLGTAPGMLNANYPARCRFVFIKPRK